VTVCIIVCRIFKIRNTWYYFISCTFCNSKTQKTQLIHLSLVYISHLVTHIPDLSMGFISAGSSCSAERVSVGKLVVSIPSHSDSWR